jgi:predicted ATPase/DNA-binding winged helix-turn-helix (wHTH) protein
MSNSGSARRTAVPELRIDPENEWAWCGQQRLKLTPRAFAVLRHLVEHRDQLVTKESLIASVWRDTIVSDSALASCIRDLRRALDDTPDVPRYIQTVHRRGFRFIGPVAGSPPARSASDPVLESSGLAGPPRVTLVDREAALARLHGGLARARRGQRQLLFVTGEAGIGKTALVETFVAGLSGDGALRVGCGQCVEHYGIGEPYLPVLEALGRLGRAAGGTRLIEILRRHAPTWLVQLPGLLGDEDLDGVRLRTLGATRDRMLRELVEALDALTVDAPLVLLLEDLHWSDSATIDLLVMLARRPEPARLLVLGTYRPADVAGTSDLLGRVKQELLMRGHCEEVALNLLGPPAIGEYLARRFPGHAFPERLARDLHDSTEGNPLFLVSIIDYLIDQGRLQEVDGRWTLAEPASGAALGTPETLRQLVETQLERLNADERAVLAAGSVAGAEFSAALATVAGIDPEDGERWCQALARRGQFLRPAGVAEWPDGTVAGRYAFVHALYQQGLYSQVSAGRLVRLHLRTGERLERAYGERAGEIAGELARHFEEGRDFQRAVRYRGRAGEHALSRHAYREAGEHVRRALRLLETWPDSPERTQQELTLQVVLGAALTATQGFGAPDVAQPYERARELCDKVGDTLWLLPVLLGLGRFHQSRAELGIAQDLAARLLAIAASTGDATVRLAGHNAMGIMAFYGGEFEAALSHLEQGIDLYEPDRHRPDRSIAFQAGQDPGVSCMVYAAWTLHLLGRPARALAQMGDALGLARSLGHPFSAAYACHFAAVLHLCRREPEAVMELEDEALAHSSELGFRIFPVMALLHRGWALAQRGRGTEGLTRMREGLATLRAIGIELRRPMFLGLIAEVCGAVDQVDEGLAALAEARAQSERTAQRYWDAELHRLEGRLSLRSGTAAAGAAERSFREAIEIARRQSARSLELRAATDLSRLWAGHGKAREAHGLLSGALGSLPESQDILDVREARSLLHDLEVRAGSGRARRSGRS